ncbi:MAG TPA: hypothetical protein PLB79_08395, partial [Thermotogota bacterium]|nr:hypothetical protein [Thermotogota bacterium]
MKKALRVAVSQLNTITGALNENVKNLEQGIALGHEIELIDPVEGLPDMVYTANGGFLIDGIAYGPKFRFAE